ncbi:MAG: response regulator, partial [Myxococcaceae bacterium]|nr:response regulator [Myxococcaceae bacterium]
MTTKILVVDDNPQLLRAVAGILSRAKFSPECYGDAESALEALHGSSYDVIISDQAMPGM